MSLVLIVTSEFHGAGQIDRVRPLRKVEGGRFLAVGIASMIVVQAFINISVVLGPP